MTDTGSCVGLLQCMKDTLTEKSKTSLAIHLALQWQTPTWNERAIRFYQHLGAKSKQKVRFFFSGADLETFLT